MDQQPPPVTIVDPKAARPEADVLTSGSERAQWSPAWRPSWRQKLTGLLVVAVVAATVVGVRHVLDVRHEKALDRTAIAEISLRVGDEDSTYFFDVGNDVALSIPVVNEAAHAVTVTSASLAAGAESTELSMTLVPNTSVVLSFEDRRACSMELAGDHPDELVLGLRTERGGRTTRSVPLPGWAKEQLADAYAMRCGLQEPDQALQVDISGVRRLGGGVEITYQLMNTSVLPVTVDRIEVPTGLAVKGPRLPLSLPPAKEPGSAGAPTVVRFRITVEDCDKLHRAAPEDSFMPLVGLAAHVRSTRGEGISFVPLSYRESDLDVDEELYGSCGLQPPDGDY